MNLNQADFNAPVFLCRILLIIMLVVGAFMAFQPSLNLSTLTPNHTMRLLGFSYHSILAYEHHFHIFLHLLCSFLLVILIYGARLFAQNNAMKRLLLSVLVVLFLSLLGELIQEQVGRNMQIIDLLYDFVGVTIAGVLLWLVNSRTTSS